MIEHFTRRMVIRGNTIREHLEKRNWRFYVKVDIVEIIKKTEVLYCLIAI